MTREEKMLKRKNAGRHYEYQPISYPVDSVEYMKERNLRAKKNRSHKLPYVVMQSLMRKLDNTLAKETAENKHKKSA